MFNPAADLLTVTGVARHFGVAPYRVKYAIESRGIQPIGRVGITRVSTRDQLPEFEDAFADMAMLGRDPEDRLGLERLDATA